MLIIVVLLLLVGCGRRVAVFEIPKGYSGRVTVGLDEAQCTGESTGLRGSVIRVSPEGRACSRVWNGDGLTFVSYYYVDSSHRRERELRSLGWGKGGEIWAVTAAPEAHQYRFFVGSEALYRRTYEPNGGRR